MKVGYLLIIPLIAAVGLIVASGQPDLEPGLENLTPGQIERLADLDVAIANAKEQEVLYDDKVHREAVVAEYIITINGHINNPEVGPSMRKHLQENLAPIIADNGIAAFAKRKANYIQHQADLETRKLQIIAEYEVVK